MNPFVASSVMLLTLLLLLVCACMDQHHQDWLKGLQSLYLPCVRGLVHAISHEMINSAYLS